MTPRDIESAESLRVFGVNVRSSPTYEGTATVYDWSFPVLAQDAATAEELALTIARRTYSCFDSNRIVKVSAHPFPEERYPTAPGCIMGYTDGKGNIGER